MERSEEARTKKESKKGIDRALAHHACFQNICQIIAKQMFIRQNFVKISELTKIIYKSSSLSVVTKISIVLKVSQ